MKRKQDLRSLARRLLQFSMRTGFSLSGMKFYDDRMKSEGLAGGIQENLSITQQTIDLD